MSKPAPVKGLTIPWFYGLRRYPEASIPNLVLVIAYDCAELHVSAAFRAS